MVDCIKSPLQNLAFDNYTQLWKCTLIEVIPVMVDQMRIHKYKPSVTCLPYFVKHTHCSDIWNSSYFTFFS